MELEHFHRAMIQVNTHSNGLWEGEREREGQIQRLNIKKEIEKVRRKYWESDTDETDKMFKEVLQIK